MISEVHLINTSQTPLKNRMKNTSNNS